MARFIPIINGCMQNVPQEEENIPMTSVEEGAEWYEVIEIPEEELPTFNPQTERREEYNYEIHAMSKTATPLYRIMPKYNFTGSAFEDKCPLCVDDYLTAEDRDDNIVLQSLAKGVLKTVDTI